LGVWLLYWLGTNTITRVNISLDTFFKSELRKQYFGDVLTQNVLKEEIEKPIFDLVPKAVDEATYQGRQQDAQKNPHEEADQAVAFRWIPEFLVQLGQIVDCK
jgi:hypothetical protein